MTMTQLKNQLCQIINTANMPAEEVYFVIKDVYRDVIEAYNNYLYNNNKQIQEAVGEDDSQEEKKEEVEVENA